MSKGNKQDEIHGHDLRMGNSDSFHYNGSDIASKCNSLPIQGRRDLGLTNKMPI